MTKLMMRCSLAVDPAALSIPPEGFDTTVKPETVAPPLKLGGRNDTTAEALYGVAARMIGALGTERGTTVLDALEAAPVPTTLVATAVKV